MHATITGEGPLGKSRRGSWLVAARQSYLTWPPSLDAHHDAFGFGDAIGRAVFDVRPSQQVGVTVLRGTSNVDDEEDGLAAGESGGAINTTTMANVAWRSAIGSSTLIHQRVYVVRHQVAPMPASELAAGRGVDTEVAYRASVARSLGRGLFDGGIQLSRLGASDAAAVDAAATQRSAYGHFRWNVTTRATISPGLRITLSDGASRPIVSRWLLGEYAVSDGWRLRASAGLSYQLPELRLVAGPGATLRPEQAMNVDVSLEHRLSQSATWEFTVFDRQESNVMRERPASVETANGLTGTARGVELQIARRHSTGLNGWAAYSYGKARQHDEDRGETSRAAFDQRHALTLVGWYQVAAGTSVGMTYRAASNFPVPTYLQEAIDRLPTYSRLDVRADHHLRQLGGHVTVFGEVVNLTNHLNRGIREASIVSEGDGTRLLMRRRAAAGMVVEF
jgi:hypothetical protein